MRQLNSQLRSYLKHTRKQVRSLTRTREDRILWLGIGLFFLVILLGTVATLTIGRSRLANYQNISSRVTQSNDTRGASNARVVMHVSVARFDDKGIPSIEPAPGNTLIILRVSITNKSKHSIDFYPSIQSYIRDAQGGYYTMRPAMVSNPYEAGPILPGKTVSGELSYEVPKKLVQPRYYIDADWDGGPVIFALTF